MEKHSYTDGGNVEPTKTRERSLLLPLLGLLSVVFTGAFLSAFVLTTSSLETLSVKDATLRRQIELLRLQVESMRNVVKDIHDSGVSVEELEKIAEETFQENAGDDSKKRQVQALGFMDAILKAQEAVFEKYCHDHSSSCPQGPAGVKGPVGENGTDGVVIGNVTQNGVGAPGLKGDQGEPGIQGINGTSGDIGIIGDPGQKGAPGVQGPQGAQGENGTKGPVGEPGGKGLQGTQGTKGNTGDIGIQGIDGYMGMQGDPGVNGTAGQKGPIGDTGTPGPRGSPSSLWTDPQCGCLAKPPSGSG